MQPLVDTSTTDPGKALDAAAEGSRARVLVVDDDVRNLIAIETVLEPVAEVVRASSGEEALRCLLRQEFAVILLDVNMPGLDGYETASFVRKREQSRRTPVIFLTAINKEDVHMLRGYDMGAVDYVFKPFDPVIIRSKVAVFVDLYEKTREIARKAALEQRLLEENLRANAEKLRMETALRQSEARQALLLRSLPIALYVEKLGEAERSPQLVGGDVRTLTGFDAEDLAAPGRWAERIHPEDARFADHRGILGAPGGILVTEYRWRCAEDRIKHFLDHAVLLHGEDGEPTGIAGTLLDVTERRQLEDRLIQAQKLDAIGKLTGGVAHDFNNLLASVLGGLRLIERRTTLDEPTAKIFEMTRHAAEQGAELIRRMLAFSRRQHLRPDVLPLETLHATMEGMVGHILGGLIRFEWRLPTGLWPAYADAGQLELALMNLVLNARDALPEGGTIAISAANRTLDPDNELGLPAGDYVALAVTDTGCGIAAETLPHVVEPFFTTKEVGKGNGLGLSTVYGFARQSGGTLSIDSVEGRGTHVEVWLPRALQSGDAAPVEKPIAAAMERLAASGRKPVVLLVDDAEDLRRISASLLAEHGFGVVEAAGGGQAFALLEKDPDRFDLIITDFAMPLVSGLDVVRFARNLRVDIPAIIVTGYADTVAVAGRPDDVPLLTKPFAEAELIGLAATVLARGRRGARAGAAE